MNKELDVNYIGQVSEAGEAERLKWNASNVYKQVPHKDGVPVQFQQEPAADPRLIANGVVYGD